MVSSDAHEGILYGLNRVFPEVPWQRCQTHFSRNVLELAPAKYQTEIHDRMLAMYNSESVEVARRIRDSIVADFSDVAEKAMKCLDDGFEDTMTVMCLPKETKRYLRTTNHLERLNKELKRRSKVIGIFPTEQSIIRLMGSVLLEIHDRYSAGEGVHIPKKDMKMLPLMKSEFEHMAKEQQKFRVA